MNSAIKCLWDCAFLRLALAFATIGLLLVLGSEFLSTRPATPATSSSSGPEADRPNGLSQLSDADDPESTVRQSVRPDSLGRPLVDGPRDSQRRLSQHSLGLLEQDLRSSIASQSHETPFELYLVRRQQLAIEKLRRGEYSVCSGQEASMTRRAGDPDFMAITTDDYVDGERQWVRIVFDESDGSILKPLKDLAANTTIEEWQGFVDDFNSRPLAQRLKMIMEHIEAGEELRRLGELELDRDEFRRRKKEIQGSRLPWYVSVDEIGSWVNVSARAVRLARDRGGFH